MSAGETGGLSGVPLLTRSLDTVRSFYKLTGGTWPPPVSPIPTKHYCDPGRIPIVGCGGIASAEDALAFCRAGASVVQIYTALGYAGPGLVERIKRDVALQLGSATWAETVGSGNK